MVFCLQLESCIRPYCDIISFVINCQALVETTIKQFYCSFHIYIFNKNSYNEDTCLHKYTKIKMNEGGQQETKQLGTVSQPLVKCTPTHTHSHT